VSTEQRTRRDKDLRVTEKKTRREKDLGVTEKKTIREGRIWWKQRRKPEVKDLVEVLCR
jgi:hypothetical protein